ncbi:ABC transporter ATP-binding protein [Marinobacter sp.]|uniref:ABC transporter ATP-binding protein n=1 Tax=Marinobacter sp. TaxID=50741 RepID=UPI003569AD6B
MNSKTDSASNSSPGKDTAIEVSNLGFSWQRQQETLTFPDFCLKRGEHLFLHGPSGSGKSTLLSLLAGMLRPVNGAVRVLGTDIHRLGAGARDQFRADHMGVIFQQFNLVPYLNTLANVTLPCGLSDLRRQRSEPTVTDEAEGLLTALSIPEDHWQRKVTRLSIGQQQRIAAARALIGAPGVILADEPTSALDADNRDRFLDLLLTLAHRHNTSVLFVSHDQSLAHHFGNRLELRGNRT